MTSTVRDTAIQLTQTVYAEVYDPEYALSRLEVSRFVEISLVTDGVGIRQTLHEAAECRLGEIYLHGSGVPHGFFAKSETEAPTVQRLRFSPAALLGAPFADPEAQAFCYGVFRDKVPLSYAMLNARALTEVQRLYDRIGEELTEQGLAWSEAVKAHLVLLLITLGRYVNLADTERVDHPKAWLTVSAAMRAVLEGCHDPAMTLESIAAGLFISKSYLSRLFRQVTGESFADYVRQVRLSLACRLLTDTALTNEEIVGRCGLRDIPTFYKIFKASMGMTPNQYRQAGKPPKGEKTMSICLEISEQLQRGKAKAVKELVAQAVEQGIPAGQILNDGLLAGMNIVGERFKQGEVYVPEVLVAARAMNGGMEILKPLLVEDGVQATGKVCLGTVRGDLHDIGKNLVKMMMEGKGLDVVDLGTDVAPEAFVDAAVNQGCQVICCSALLTTTMDVMAEVVQAVETAGIRDRVKIMIGGAPITQEFCDKIGADRYTSDAASAADAAVELCRC